MDRVSSINLPLHSGKCPRWLFEKMKRLCASISEAIIYEQGPEVFLEKLSSAYWFQAFGCALGFDWHSSGLTTTVGGALKAANYLLNQYGIYVCGGKAKAALNTPEEIELFTYKLNLDPAPLLYASRLAAKVDNAALLDGFSLYHHNFIFSRKQWIIIQQGMDKTSRFARRYHWASDNLKSFTQDPHKEIITAKKNLTLNMVATEAKEAQETSVSLSQREPSQNVKEIKLIQQTTLPLRHQIFLQDINPRYLYKIFLKTYQAKPQDFAELLSLEGVGPKTIRALALISELIYGSPLSFRDPARFSFAHGGKDGYPYKIDLNEYQRSLDILQRAINKAKIDRSDRIKVLRKIYYFYNSLNPTWYD